MPEILLNPEEPQGPNYGERSWIWGGSSVGDAQIIAPYHTSWFMGYLTLMARLTSTLKYGVLPTNKSPYSGLLAPSNPAGFTVRIASGAAMNRRIIYFNDANVDFDCSHTGYYTIVLRCDYTAQTVRLHMLGYSPMGYPSPVKSGYINDIVICFVHNNSSTVSITDRRRFTRNLMLTWHSGEALNWYIPSGTNKMVKGSMMEAGSIEPVKTLMIESSSIPYPRAYPTGTAPVLFLQATGGNSTPEATQLFSKSQNGNEVNYYLDSINNIAFVWWLSFGLLK